MANFLLKCLRNNALRILNTTFLLSWREYTLVLLDILLSYVSQEQQKFFDNVLRVSLCNLSFLWHTKYIPKLDREFLIFLASLSFVLIRSKLTLWWSKMESARNALLCIHVSSKHCETVFCYHTQQRRVFVAILRL